MTDGRSARTAERFTSVFAYHGEGPFWDSRGDRLLCMDVLAGSVVSIDSLGETRRHAVPSSVATVIRRRSTGGFVIATERGIVAADDDLTTFEEIAVATTDAGVRTNDGGCDPLGGLVIGTMSHEGMPGRGAVYRVTPELVVTEILGPVSISNGVQWSADGKRVFYIDTPSRCVDVFDVDPHTGAWSNRRTHIRVEDGQGFPDGMAIDEDDGLWIALWGGGAVNHYDRTGRIVEAIGVPGVTQASSCAFGGQDRDVLYITTSRQGLDADQEPDAGAVFVVSTGVRGAVQGAFAG